MDRTGISSSTLHAMQQRSAQIADLLDALQLLLVITGGILALVGAVVLPLMGVAGIAELTPVALLLSTLLISAMLSQASRHYSSIAG